ncbi:MAG TPA: hypothetical protein VMH30_00435 [Verrucomicrobiae bacterium]|nr:hypothetical protein [Verrucomicrobiae bacterium]
MFELFEANPRVSVLEAEYQRLLGYPKQHVLEGRSRDLAEAAREWYAQNGRPWIYAREIGRGNLELADERVRVAGTEFSSKQLRDQFMEAEVESAVVVAVSAGRECEEESRRLWQESKPDEYFFMEIFGSAVVEHLVTIASGRICGWADGNQMMALPHYSPGYTGWDIGDQGRLWALIQGNGRVPNQSSDPHLALTDGRSNAIKDEAASGVQRANFLRNSNLDGRLEVLAAGMLRPKKSLLAILGLTRNLEKARRLAKLIPCESCSLPGCMYRRGAYQQAPRQIEDVRQLNNAAYKNGELPIRDGALTPNAKYTVNSKALRKWSHERLRLEFLPDGAIEARFRYDGTTCSNMGRALAFDYRIKLSSPEDQYTILEAECGPSPEDTGNEYQCESLNDAEALAQSIATEKPLLGRPLDEVLTWQRGYDPSGCFCDTTRRLYKWGLAYEVIHFTLAQKLAMKTRMED